MNTVLKILLLSRDFWEDHENTQGESPLEQLTEAVAELGHHVVVLSQSLNVKGLTHSKLGKVDLLLTPRDQRRFGLTALYDWFDEEKLKHSQIHTDVSYLHDVLVKKRPDGRPFDVVWASSESPDGLVAAMAAKRRSPIPPIVTQIQTLRYEFQNGQQRFNDQRPLGLSFKYASLVLANSELVANDIVEHYAETTGKEQLKQKTKVLSPNFSRAFINTASAARTQKMPEKSRVLFLGDIHEQNGPLLFLKSLPFCCSAGGRAGISFAIVGDYMTGDSQFQAQWESALREARSVLKSVSKHLSIDLLGQLDMDQILVEIKRATVVVMPSMYEEFSSAVAEVLASGRPVITTDKVGGAQLITGKGTEKFDSQKVDMGDGVEVETYGADDTQPGFVVKSNDEEMLGWAIASALDPYSPQAQNARRMAPEFRKQLSPEAIADRLVSYLQLALSNKSA